MMFNMCPVAIKASKIWMLEGEKELYTMTTKALKTAAQHTVYRY